MGGRGLAGPSIRRNSTGPPGYGCALSHPEAACTLVSPLTIGSSTTPPRLSKRRETSLIRPQAYVCPLTAPTKPRRQLLLYISRLLPAFRARSLHRAPSHPMRAQPLQPLHFLADPTKRRPPSRPSRPSLHPILKQPLTPPFANVDRNRPSRSSRWSHPLAHREAPQLDLNHLGIHRQEWHR
ncbi:hypothetical protein BDV98DRAFT_657437 [Pterulicium gracile]|uniref:Uncharacterized protein n=1 Tax=Pterulicium gracile TaxID=1884261 RepID=A0A5C3QC62_9AGAR|nr:hypothetical protein BDV98DRAFT_657437 [Pterula gracilis]